MMLWKVRVGDFDLEPVVVDSAQRRVIGPRTFTVTCDGDPSSMFFLLCERVGQQVTATPHSSRAVPSTADRVAAAWGTLDEIQLPRWSDDGSTASITCTVGQSAH